MLAALLSLTHSFYRVFVDHFFFTQAVALLVPAIALSRKSSGKVGRRADIASQAC
jgi:hypothetical protein